MKKQNRLAKEHLFFFCEKTINRSTGSIGNIEATAYFETQLKKYDWRTETQEFEVFDWSAEQAFVSFNDLQIKVDSSPYSQTGVIKGETIIVSKIEELVDLNAKGKILILKDTLSNVQLMPKNFVFYNPELHRKIISLIEKSSPEALIFTLNKKDSYGGGEYPFPIIEDGDFLIPSVFMSEEDGGKIISKKPKKIEFISKTSISPSKGFNVIGRKGPPDAKKVTITTHIDAKKNTPGAIDNATGVTCLLLLAEKMEYYEGPYQIELIALNGEDHYSVPGQMTYLKSKKMNFGDIVLNINIDGAGLDRGSTALSHFNPPNDYLSIVKALITKNENIVEGIQWFQGDHSMFLQNGVPAIAITSDWLLTNNRSQNITHTKNDTIDIVEIGKLTEIVCELSTFINNLP